MSKAIRILLADDHMIVRMGISALIGKERDMTIVGEAGNGHEAVELAERLQPNVILMDLMMPQMNGVQATRQILERNPSARILILTTFGESEDVRQALGAGASGAVVKDTSMPELVDAIRRTAAGDRIIGQEIRSALGTDAPQTRLTDRQLEVLGYIAKGMTNKDISRIMGISPDGVSAHLRAIFTRIGASSRSEAVAFALNSRLLNP